MIKEVDDYLLRCTSYAKQQTALRNLLLGCGLTETYKWKQPCYMYNNKNVVIIGAFKEYCALLFFKGALLTDTNNLLTQPTANTFAGRQMRFVTLHEITTKEPIIMTYVYEAIEVEKLGLKATSAADTKQVLIPELEKVFATNKAFEKAYYKLTPGKQRAYHLHFSKSNNSTTRTANIEKNVARILNGIGLQDCTCGLSKRMPRCDGSHKDLVKN